MIGRPESKPFGWEAWPFSSPERVVRTGVAAIGACTVGLIGYCLYRFPPLRTWSYDGLVSALAVVVVTMSYVLIGWLGSRSIERRTSPILRVSLPWGVGAGSAFGLTMLGEYLVPHDGRQGELVALTVFGVFFAVLFAAGFSGTRSTRRVSTGAFAGFWSALIASQLWVFFLFATYLFFLETPQEARFLEVDQVIADFVRSGKTDLRVFIFGDYTGAAFFHSLLGAILGLLLGGLGGLAAWPLTGKWIEHAQRR